jgi:hypothetical protein
MPKKRYLRSSTSGPTSVPATSDLLIAAADVSLPIGYERNVRLLYAHVAVAVQTSIVVRDLKMALLWQDGSANILFSLFMSGDTPPYGLTTASSSEIVERAIQQSYDVRWDDDIVGNPQNVVYRATALVSNTSAGAINVTVNTSAAWEFI